VYYIYILQSKTSDHFYSGYSDDPWRRTVEHNTKPFNTYTSKHRPWGLAAVFECSEKESVAIKIERFIKKQKSRRLLEKLIDPSFDPTGILTQLVRVPHVRD
jgi:putative endonuclease